MMKHRRRNVVGCAIAATACGAVGVATSSASVIFELRATAVTGAGTIGNGGRSVSDVVNGSVINYQVHALVEATTADVIATQPDTAPEGFMAVAGIIRSD